MKPSASEMGPFNALPREWFGQHGVELTAVHQARGPPMALNYRSFHCCHSPQGELVSKLARPATAFQPTHQFS